MNTASVQVGGTLSVHLDVATLEKVQSMLGATKREASKLLRFSINDALGVAKTDMAQMLGTKINLKAADIKPAIKVTKANFSNLTGRLRLRGGTIPLIKFKGTVQRKAGVSVKVLTRGAPRTIIPHTMIATMPSGHKGVFWRKRVGADLVPRLPIHERKGPSIPAVFENDKEMFEGTLKLAKTNMQARLEHYLDSYARRVGLFEGRNG